MAAEKLQYGNSPFPPILPVAGEVFPLAFCQQGFWSLEQLVPNNSFSNLVLALRVRGNLAETILQRAFDEIVRRHAILRTAFKVAEGLPIQVVSAVVHLAVAIEDLGELPESEREIEFFRRAIRDFHQPFDFTQAPLLRVTLYQIGPHEQVLVETMHHIIGDSWSLQILNRELAILYEAFSRGEPSPLMDLTIQYADFSVWQRRLLKEKLLEDQRSYWKQKLSNGNLSVERLPLDHPAPTESTFKSTRQTISLPRALSQELKNLGYDEGCTVFMVLLSVCKILLSKALRQSDVRIGTVLAIRKQSQIEELIGPFINTLLLRTDLSGDPTLRVILRRVRDTVLEAFDNQEIPFEEVLQTFESESHLDRSSLFKVMFLFEGPQIQDLAMPGLTIEQIDIKGAVETTVTVTTFDLIFTFGETRAGLTGTLIYKTDRFDGDTIRQFLKFFHNVAEWMVARPDVALSVLTE